MEIGIASAVALIWIALNIAATRHVLRDDISERAQKAAQLAVVWLIPLIGAILVLAVHRSAEPPSRKYYEPANMGHAPGADESPGRPASRIDLDPTD